MNMKEFVKWVLAVLLGLFIWGIIKMVFLFMMIGSLGSSAASSSSTPTLPKEGVMLMDMSKFVLSEQGSSSDMSSLTTLLSSGGMTASVGILDAIEGVRKAAEDPGVKYILLKADGAASSVTGMEEFRKVLTEFRKSGKAIVAYGESFTSGSYYIASVADKIYTTSHHGGNVFMLGMSGSMMFLKDLLDKLGVNYQLIRHGKYKSAGETYIKNAPSPENMEQNQVMIDSMWETMSKETAESRGVPVDSLNYFIDNLSISFPEDMVTHGLADGVLSVEEYKTKIADLAGKDSYKDVKFIKFPEYVSAKVKPNTSAKKKIAVIYANGNIVEGNGTSNIAGDRFASVIAKVRSDSTIKAVVFRVNSPGGTVLAASKIKEEIDALQATKPVIASYGEYAASGGYWISNGCDKIFSNATTLTGSIGVFSAIPEFSNTLKNIAHVNMVPVKSHEHSDMLSLTRPFDETETAWMQEYVEDIYERFVNIVAEGRDMAPASVDSIAQGRVWTGLDAIKIGLVDEIGTLDDAIRYAASMGGDEDVSAWQVESYPKPKSQFEQILEQLGMPSDTEEEVVLAAFKDTPFEAAAKEVYSWTKTWAKGANEKPIVFARLPYVIDIR